MDPRLKQEIEELRECAMDPTERVTKLLRRAKIVAAKFGDSSMASWLSLELGGYPEGTLPPDWRRARGLLRSWSGQAWLPIDFSVDPELGKAVPDWLPIGHEIAQIEALAEGEGPFAHRPADELNSLVGAPVAFRVPRAQFRSILEAVRERVLDWTIELEKNSSPTQMIATEQASEDSMPTESDQNANPRRVFIIHGRNLNAAVELARFVRALGLEPLDFDELRAEMGGTPTVADIVTEGMKRCQGVIALFTGDEWAALRPEHRGPNDKGEAIQRWQARPNVIFEAGMAFARDRKRVVFVQFGDVDLFTDVAGVHVLRPTNAESGARHTLRNTLRAMGCPVNESAAWMTEGDFESCVVPGGAQPQDPFRDLER